MSHSPERLNIQRSVPIKPMDEYPNPAGSGQIQDSIGGRPTEDSATHDPSGEVYKAIYQDGQFVDDTTMLFCSHKDCHRWKPDNAFDVCQQATARRGRYWYCKECRAKSRRQGDNSTEADRALRATLGKSKRRKR